MPFSDQCWLPVVIFSPVSGSSHVIVKYPARGADDAVASTSLFAGYLKVIVAVLSPIVSTTEANELPVIRLYSYIVNVIRTANEKSSVSTPSTSFMTLVHEILVPTYGLK